MNIRTRSSLETYNFGVQLAKKVRGGQIFALIGDLGAGKTCFTKGFAKGLGVRSAVASPSFVLMKVYPITLPDVAYFCHVDVYRLSRLEEVLAVGIEEHIGKQHTITVIEWADKIGKLLSSYTRTELTFTFVGKHSRLISVQQKSAQR